MVRFYGFLSPAKRRLLEEVVYVITETVRKTARQITLRGIYQRLLKVDPLKCVLCGSQMRFTGLKRGYRLTELVVMHEPPGPDAVVRLRAAERKLRSFYGKWSKKPSLIPSINQCQQ